VHCIEDEDPGVRQAAIDALPKVAARGNGMAVRALMELLKGHNCPLPFLRRQAVIALGQVSAVGDAQVIQTLLLRLDDSNERVREVAAEAVKQVSEHGDECVVEALLQDLLEEQ